MQMSGNQPGQNHDHFMKKSIKNDKNMRRIQ